MLDFIKEKQTAWKRLAETKKPIVLYGMGNGADKILDWCEANEVRVAGIFASDQFVRGQCFRGFKIERYQDICDRLEDFLLVIAFASESPVLLQYFKELAAKHETIAPHLPLFDGDAVVSEEWLEKYAEKLQYVYEHLADDCSRKVLAAVLNYKLGGVPHWLWNVETARSEDLKTLFEWEPNEEYLDLGAYKGDTIEEFLQLVGNKYKNIIAVEPDRRNFKKLQQFVQVAELENTSLLQAGIWDCKTELNFSDSGGRQSTFVQASKQIVGVDSIDNILEGKNVTYIKMDVEGVEKEALLGGKIKISTNKPKLFIAAYHHDEDLFELPLLLWKLVPDYKIYLRKHPYIPDWEMNFLVKT